MKGREGMITLKRDGYKREDYKFIQLAFRVGMEKIFLSYCLEADCDTCKYKRACVDIIRLLEHCQKEDH